MTPLYRTCLHLLACIVLITGSAVASGQNEGVEEPRTRPPSRFDHDPHNEAADLEESCALCHHLFDEDGVLLEDESSEDMACRDCHDAGEPGVPATERAFHNRCKGCHLAVKQGPIACGQCHAKNP